MTTCSSPSLSSKADPLPGRLVVEIPAAANLEITAHLSPPARNTRWNIFMMSVAAFCCWVSMPPSFAAVSAFWFISAACWALLLGLGALLANEGHAVG